MALSYNLAYQEIKTSDFCWQNRLDFLEHLTMSHIYSENTWFKWFGRLNHEIIETS